VFRIFGPVAVYRGPLSNNITEDTIKSRINYNDEMGRVISDKKEGQST
jgi:hypothetical protein